MGQENDGEEGPEATDGRATGWIGTNGRVDGWAAERFGRSEKGVKERVASGSQPW